MVLRSATSLLGALEGVGPENLDFFGPNFRAHPFQRPRNDVALLKTIAYCAIKTTGTLIVNLSPQGITLSLAYHVSQAGGGVASATERVGGRRGGTKG